MSFFPFPYPWHPRLLATRKNLYRSETIVEKPHQKVRFNNCFVPLLASKLQKEQIGSVAGEIVYIYFFLLRHYHIWSYIYANLKGPSPLSITQWQQTLPCRTQGWVWLAPGTKEVTLCPPPHMRTIGDFYYNFCCCLARRKKLYFRKLF